MNPEVRALLDQCEEIGMEAFRIAAVWAGETERAMKINASRVRGITTPAEAAWAMFELAQDQAYNFENKGPELDRFSELLATEAELSEQAYSMLYG